MMIASKCAFLWLLVDLSVALDGNLLAFNSYPLSPPRRIERQENHLRLAKFNDNQPRSDSKKRLRSFRTATQIRRKPTNRRPKYFWTNVDNLRSELQEFWKNCGVETENPNGKPCIPNEALLNFFGRHDLRAAIASQGGRGYVASQLGGATIMPGKWTEAVETSRELQILLRNETLNLSSERFSYSESSKQRTELEENQVGVRLEKRRWAHKPSRNPRGYWNRQKIVKELYDYLEDYKVTNGRPSIWMPRPSELAANGREDLKDAIYNNLGGAKRVCQMSGLVPVREWNFFEGQYELFLLLRDYIDAFHDTSDGDDVERRYYFFPSATEIRNNGYERLYNLIQFYGGRKFLANRLGMTHGKQADHPAATNSNQRLGALSWGRFSLVFAIRLCEFIRKDHLAAVPPISNPVICIPTISRLRQVGAEGKWLHDKIVEFGGYENVARRLYLGY